MSKRRRHILFGSILLVGFLGAWLYLRLCRPFFFEFGKGGTAAIGEGYFAGTEERTNGLSGSSVRAWKGQGYQMAETVMIASGEVVPFTLWRCFDHHALVVRFTPERIYVYEWRRFRGGYYTRRPEGGLPASTNVGPEREADRAGFPVAGAR